MCLPTIAKFAQNLSTTKDTWSEHSGNGASSGSAAWNSQGTVDTCSQETQGVDAGSAPAWISKSEEFIFASIGESSIGSHINHGKETTMSHFTSGQTINPENQDLVSSADLSKNAKSPLTKLAAWIGDREIPFLITSVGMIVMLLWAGAYKMTAPGAEGIVPLVSHSPLLS